VNKIRFAARRAFLTATACFICVAFLSAQAQNTAPQAPPTPADLKVPDGFKVSVFASDVVNARLMAVAPDGALFVARQSKGDVVALPDRDKDGKADKM
jgi:glucose/arabinose dehydrogenase